MSSTTWPVLSHYDSNHLKEIAMPVGGIGTGFFALSGIGELIDWQLMSRPHRHWRPRYANLALRTKSIENGKDRVLLRVLEGSIDRLLGDDSGSPTILAGVPRFRNVSFEAAYPYGRCLLSDDDTPVSVQIEGFNPLIPHATDDSSLPMGLLSVTIKNLTDQPLEASVTMLLTNFIGTDGIVSDLKDNITEKASAGAWKGIQFSKNRSDKTPQNGTMTILSDADDVRIARRWPFRHLPWGGEALGIIDELLEKGYIPDDEPDKACPPSTDRTWDSSITAMGYLQPAEERKFQFLVTWHFPYRYIAENSWQFAGDSSQGLYTNYYATQFTNSTQAAEQIIPRLEQLYGQTAEFVRSVVEGDAPQSLKEAAIYNLTGLRTHTSFRLSDGVFYGFEGCNSNSGCCHGSCTHVWNYEESTVNLFPDLHRSMLNSHIDHGTTPAGAQKFRLTLPLNKATWHGAAADGQMGLIVRVYEQYLQDLHNHPAPGKEDVGLAWLERVYPTVKSMIKFAWVPNGWDADKDGVMEGAQHNTYDVEFFGPNPMCTVWYLAALNSISHMADAVGDAGFARECETLWKEGSAWVDNNLYNGKYYIQKYIKPSPKVAEFTVLDEEYKRERPRFQTEQGCLVDQLVGQYKANRCSLGNLLDEGHIRTTLKAIFDNNYRPSLRDHYNNLRTYATADEGGTLICTFNGVERPDYPLPYWSECMTGLEYQFAALLLDYGFQEEGVKVVKTARDRHTGANRNPFNEPECGSYYARAMAGWALLDAWENSKTKTA